MLARKSKLPDLNPSDQLRYQSGLMSKAYENHYDVAIVIMGDRDFLPLIKSIKGYTGKRIFGVVFEKSYAEELSREFDKKLVLNEIEIKKLFKEN